MAYQTGVLEALQDWGFKLGRRGFLGLYLWEGWEDRGGEWFDPVCSVNHHTAGSRKGLFPSANVLLYGRGGPNPVKGPLCNAGLARDASLQMIAAGAANHAGKGGWRGISGNSRAWGLEVEHIGYASEPVSDQMWEAMWRFHRACMDYSGFGWENVCQHSEWAPTRKSDFVQAITNPHAFRVSLTGLRKIGREDDMTPEQLKQLQDSITAAHRATRAEVEADLLRFAQVITGAKKTNSMFNPLGKGNEWMNDMVTLKDVVEMHGYFGQRNGAGDVYYILGLGVAKIGPGPWLDWLKSLEVINKMDTKPRSVPAAAWDDMPTLQAAA